jgi:AcrR family transcriptional regulator
VIASQRARLQRALIEIAARDGLGAVTVRRLIKLAGVSTAAFYTRFSGTDDCVLTTYREIMAAATSRISATRAAEIAPADQVELALEAFFGHFLNDRDLARFALIEIYAGGPAAVTAIAAEERKLEYALREILDRRGVRFPKFVASAIVAAVLRCARVQLMDTSPDEVTPRTDALIEWARDVVDEKEELPVPSAASPPSGPIEMTWEPGRSATGDRDEEDLILAAVLRLARPDGFYGLTSSNVCAAAGLPTARFRRHFTNLADGYLTAIRRTCRSFFIELTEGGDADAPPRASVLSALHRASRRAASDPAAARLTFKQIVEAGVDGLTCRETLISELAMACSAMTPPAAETRPPVRVEAWVAALWEQLAQGAQSRSSSR